MKTWLDWDVWILFVLVWVLLMIPAVIPTVELNGEYFGGGVVREWAFNRMIVAIVPAEHNAQLIDWWEQAQIGGELAIYFLVTLNAYACLLPLTYGLGKLKIGITNWYHLKQFRTKHQNIKRK